MKGWRAARSGLGSVLPGGLLLAGLGWLLRRELDPGGQALLAALPDVAALVTGLIAVRFRQGRVVMAVVGLSLVGAVVGGTAAVRMSPAVVGTLLPIHLLMLTLSKERGVGGWAILWRCCVLAALCGVAIELQTPERAGELAQLSRPFVNLDWLARSSLPQVAHLCFLLALFAAGWRFVSGRDPIDAGLGWAAVGSWTALHGIGSGNAGLYLATAQLVLGVAVIERSHSLAYRDELTRLPGRRAFNEQLDQLDGNYVIAMVDIDHFKKLNDRHGHEVGDQVLRMVAARLAEVGGGGRAYRYGGEEFVVIHPRRTLEEVAPHLEELRASIEKSAFTVRSAARSRTRSRRGGQSGSGVRVKVTVSIGVAEPDLRSGTPSEVTAAADKALYRAKRAGRNLLRA